MVKLTTKNEKKILDFRKLFPRAIQVQVFRSQSGGYVAEITSFEKCRTQGETLSELIEMVNDAIYTYLEIPRKYLPFMPIYI